MKDVLTLVGGLLYLCLMFFLGYASMGYVLSDNPRLKGIQCEGTRGPIYANEEDHFPRCKSIVRN